VTAPAWEDLLHEGLCKLGLETRDGVQPLLTYARELARWSERLGLVHATGNDLVIRHLLDSLAGLEQVRKLISGADSPEIADIGTGGGLPGIPLACFLPEATVHLVERSGRKCDFLRGTLLASRIRNAVVVNKDVSTVHDQFRVILFRAFQPLSEPLVSQLTRLLRPGGAICAYKGRSERTRAEIVSLGDDLEARLSIEMVPVAVPFLEDERHLVVLKLESV
jgi:16S rRNA (guanine527-N7)-methyltransferase